MLNRVNRGCEKNENFNLLYLITVHYRVYKCIAILHTLVGRTHAENSMSKLDNDGKRVANIYIDLPYMYKTSKLSGLHFHLMQLYTRSSRFWTAHSKWFAFILVTASYTHVACWWCWFWAHLTVSSTSMNLLMC